MKDLLDSWNREFPRFKVIYCIGSRWANVHFGVKTKQHEPPPLPQGFETLQNSELVSCLSSYCYV